MKNRLLRRALVALSVAGLGLGVPDGAAIKGRADDEEKPKLPKVLWQTQAFTAKFAITATEYDPDRRQVVWTLKAKKDVTTRGFVGRFLDVDGVEWAVIPVRLNPAQANYREGDTVQATLRLPNNFNEVDRVVIRAR